MANDTSNPFVEGRAAARSGKFNARSAERFNREPVRTDAPSLEHVGRVLDVDAMHVEGGHDWQPFYGGDKCATCDALRPSRDPVEQCVPHLDVDAMHVDLLDVAEQTRRALADWNTSQPMPDDRGALKPSAFECGSALAFDVCVRDHVRDALEQVSDGVDGIREACACLAAAARRISELQRNGTPSLEPILDDVLCVLEYVAANADPDNPEPCEAMIRYLDVFAGRVLGERRLGEQDW